MEDPKVSYQRLQIQDDAKESLSVKHKYLKCASAWQFSDYLWPLMQNKPACLRRLPRQLAHKQADGKSCMNNTWKQKIRWIIQGRREERVTMWMILLYCYLSCS